MEGLRAAGYEIRTASPGLSETGNVMVGWNRYGAQHELAIRFEQAGGIYIAAENAYIWEGGISPHSLKARPAYALARGYHNDSTVIPEGSEDRWSALGVTPAPWRAAGEHILVCPNRAFGTPGRAMPPDWSLGVRQRLAKLTKREIRVRPHPGNDAPRKPLSEDLAGCHAVVIWSSSAGVHALCAGVPVICEAPFWIAKDVAGADLEDIESPPMPDRPPALRRLAWGQFSVEEIASGVPFAHLLRPTRQAEIAPSA